MYVNQQNRKFGASTILFLHLLLPLPLYCPLSSIARVINLIYRMRQDCVVQECWTVHSFRSRILIARLDSFTRHVLSFVLMIESSATVSLAPLKPALHSLSLHRDTVIVPLQRVVGLLLKVRVSTVHMILCKLKLNRRENSKNCDNDGKICDRTCLRRVW